MSSKPKRSLKDILKEAEEERLLQIRKTTKKRIQRRKREKMANDNDNDKGDLVDIYRRIFDTWESYTLKALDMKVWRPFLPMGQVGRFLEPISKLGTQYLEWMFGGLKPSLRRDIDEAIERISTFEVRILTLESKVERIEGAVEGTRTSKRISRKKKEEAVGEEKRSR